MSRSSPDRTTDIEKDIDPAHPKYSTRWLARATYEEGSSRSLTPKKKTPKGEASLGRLL